MITEQLDKHSGAIIFKKDKESTLLEILTKRVETLEEENKTLKTRIDTIEKIVKS